MAPVIGQPLDVYGRWKKDHESAIADGIDIKRIRHEDVSGFAVIDATPGANSAVPGATEIRVDGYRMLITAQTRAIFKPPLRGIQDAMTNVWVQYNAKARPDGLFVLTKAKFWQNIIMGSEEALRAKTEYDPATVPPDADPDTIAAAIGIAAVDPKRIPPWPDRDEQKRIDTIGQKLVPAWENNLAASDPSRIAFRFQLIDGTRWPYIMALPSGIILVPHEVVERLGNDSQLAAVLADSIACVLEKQSWRDRIRRRGIRSEAIASVAMLGPILGGGAAGAEEWAGHSALANSDISQSERVSLDLMQDAGYDIYEAPKACWLLASKKPKPIDQIAMPGRSEYLYRVLGELWSGQP
jgi:hypothetical protein